MLMLAAAQANRLIDAIDRAGNPVCVGIDPVAERIPETLPGRGDLNRAEAFCFGVIEAVAGRVGVVKPQSACFERFGSAGVALLERVVSRARDAGLVVILDAKRGDIGSSSAHYAAAAGAMGADWVTVNAYLGVSGIEPFLDEGLGVFALVRTSNPDSDEIQSAGLAGGGTVAEHVAEVVNRLGRGHAGASGLSAVGAVVGATKAPEAGARLRAAMPDQPFLIPGVGAQGGNAADVRSLARANQTGGRAGVVVNASRSVIYAEPAAGETWQGAVARAADALAVELREAFA